MATLDSGLSPSRGWICVGAYEGAAVVAGVAELYGCAEGRHEDFVARCLKVFPKASLLFFELASGVNYFGYATYLDGVQRRALAGDSERGIVVDVGELEEEEKPLYEESLVRDGSRVFRTKVNGIVKDFSAPAYGERLVFSMTARYLGRPLDEFAAEKLPVELVKVHTGALAALRDLLGRRRA